MSFRVCVFALVVAAVCSLPWLSVAPVHAQEETDTPTPTITATPPYEQAVVLSSGDQFVIERRITFGQIAVVVALGILIVIVLLFGLMSLVTQWLR